MNTRALPPLLVAAVALACGPHASAQGVFLFTNAQAPKGKPVVGCDGTPLSGPDYRVDLAVLNPATGTWDAAIEVASKDGSWSKAAPVSLKEGKLAGLFQGGTVRVPFVAPGKEARLRIRAWIATQGADYDHAKTRTEAQATVVLGGGGQLPSLPGRIQDFPALKLCP